MILREVYQNIKDAYKIQLLAGENGLDRSIDWVHSIEDKEVISFLHGDELVLTTGIASETSDWLYSFVEGLIQKKACALLVNAGPYIKEIPKKVLKLCEKEKFSLFQVPWEVRLVDLTKAISAMIFAREKEQIQLVNCMKDAIFYPDEESSYCNPLKRLGYLIHKNFCPILMEIKGRRLDENNPSNTLELMKYFVSFRFPKAIFFSVSKYYVIVMYQGTKKDIDACMRMIKKFEQGYDDFQVSNIITGPNQKDIRNLNQSYQIACKMTNLAKKKGKDVLQFDKLDSYQIILNIKNIELLKIYFQERLECLLTNKELFQLFRDYLNTDCSVQKTAKQYFCHRNTINQRIKKIKNILKIEELTIQKKKEYLLAYEIYDVLYV